MYTTEPDIVVVIVDIEQSNDVAIEYSTDTPIAIDLVTIVTMTVVDVVTATEASTDGAGNIVAYRNSRQKYKKDLIYKV